MNTVAAYLRARAAVIASGYEPDIDWQNSVSLDRVTEQVFLGEHAFVIANSGMRASVIRGLWPRLRVAFGEFRSAASICIAGKLIRERALTILNSPPKIDAMLAGAAIVEVHGWKNVHARLSEKNAINYLRTFPYIGPIIVYHLAKNLGLPYAKPDRHLVRIARAFGQGNVQKFCEQLAAETGDKVSVVDLVLWRFAASVEPSTYLETLVSWAV